MVVIGVFSGKGGVGKTTLVANLGASISNTFNKNVVILDSNIHTSHLGLHFGLYEDVPVTLREVLNKKANILNTIYIHPNTGVRVIPAPLSGEDINLTARKCSQLVGQVRNNYDMVILDAAPGLGKEVLTPMYAIDGAIIVSTPDIPSLTDAIKTIELLKKFKKNVFGLVINRYRKQRYELTPEEIGATTNVNILATIPEDSKIPESISKGSPVVVSYPNSSSSNEFKRLAASLVGAEYSEENIFSKILRYFRV